MSIMRPLGTSGQLVRTRVVVVGGGAGQVLDGLAGVVFEVPPVDGRLDLEPVGGKLAIVGDETAPTGKSLARRGGAWYTVFT